MSKVALKGDALGTGTVTLSAPNTNAVIDFELPVTGTHLASAQADGMPLGPGGDPVVESGSNSDGDWARWADGTQICYASRTTTVDINSGWGSLYLTTSTDSGNAYPVAFSATPVSSNFISDDVASNVILNCAASDGSPTTGPQFRAARGTTGTNITLKYSTIAVGRWK